MITDFLLILTACLASYTIGHLIGRAEGAHPRKQPIAPYKLEPPTRQQAIRRPAHYKSPEELVEARPLGKG